MMNIKLLCTNIVTKTIEVQHIPDVCHLYFLFYNLCFHKRTNLSDHVLGHEGSCPDPLEEKRLDTPIMFQDGQLNNCYIVKQCNVYVEFDNSEVVS